MTGPEPGNSEFCFLSGNIEILGKQNHCFPRVQSETKQKQILEKRAEIPATASGHLQLNCALSSRATAVNISRVNCLPFDVMRNVTSSWPLAANSFIIKCRGNHEIANEWAPCSEKKRQLYI